MAKILLVEDDQSLREIYSIRLTAEGYEVVVAGDGEEALAVAVKEHPDLVLSDVMMPKISGFDMLDILRSTPETKEIKVIMMTALSSEDQRQRGESLGADRYLVKSQVGIEDVVNVVHEVMGDLQPPVPVDTPTAQGAEPQPQLMAAPVAPAAPAAPLTQPVVAPVAAAPQGVVPPATSVAAAPVTPVSTPDPTPAAQPVATQPIAQPPVSPQPVPQPGQLGQ